MKKNLKLIVPFVLLVIVGIIYLVANNVAEKEIRNTVDNFILDNVPDEVMDYIKIDYDAGVSGLLLTPTIKDVEIAFIYNNVPKDSFVLKIEQIKLKSYEIEDYDIAVQNIHVEYDKISLQKTLVDDFGFSMSETELLSNLDYIKNIDINTSGVCSDIACNADSQISIESLFDIDQKFHLNGSEELIAFYLDNIMNPIDTSALEENPFLIFEALGMLTQIEGISYNLNYIDKGLFDNTDIQQIIEETIEVKEFKVKEIELGLSYDNDQFELNTALNTSLIEFELLISYILDVSMMMIAPEQSVQLANADISIINHGIDNILWELNPYPTKNDALMQIDDIIDQLSDDKYLQENFSNSPEGQIVLNITDEQDAIKSMIIMRNFIENPKQIAIQYSPEEPMDYLALQEMMMSSEWPEGMAIQIN